jgi:WD40 repeat protein
MGATSSAASDPPITALAFAPDHKHVLTGSQSGVQVRTWPDLKLDRSIKTELANVHDLAFSPDGKTLAVAGGSPAEKGLVELFQWPDSKLLHRLTPHKDVIHAVAWSSDSATIATASADQTVRLDHAKSGKSTLVLEGHSRGVLAVVFLPGDAQVVSAGGDETLRVWNANTGEAERLLSNHTKPVTGLAVRPATDREAPPVVASISDDRTVRLWQPTLGRMMRFARLPSEPRALTWSADGTSILVAGKDGSLRIIDPETVEVRMSISAIDGVAYCLAVASDRSVVLGGQKRQLKRIDIPIPKR